MKQKKEIDFNKKRAPRRRSRRLFLLLALFVVLAGHASFLVIMIRNDFDFAKFIGAREPSEETGVSETAAFTEESSAAPFTDTDTVNVLFYCTDDGAASFFELAIFSAKENAVRVKPIAMDGLYRRDGRDYTPGALYETFGISAVKAALEERSYPVHRTVGFTETNLKRVLQRLGETRVNVPRDVEFRADGITYTLFAGPQSMKSDTLVQYMKYAYTGDDKLHAEGAAFAEVLRVLLTPDNLEKGEAFFSDLVNMAQTDISMFDYAGYRDRLAAFLAAGPAFSVIS